MLIAHSACGEGEEGSFEGGNLSVSSVNDEYTCEGNGKMCIAKNYLLTCKDSVVTIAESSECADAMGEYVPPENRPASFDCQFEQMNSPKCTCKGTGSTCETGWKSQYYVTCTAGSANVRACGNGCDPDAGCQ